MSILTIAKAISAGLMGGLVCAGLSVTPALAQATPETSAQDAVARPEINEAPALKTSLTALPERPNILPSIDLFIYADLSKSVFQPDASGAIPAQTLSKMIAQVLQQDLVPDFVQLPQRKLLSGKGKVFLYGFAEDNPSQEAANACGDDFERLTRGGSSDLSFIQGKLQEYANSRDNKQATNFACLFKDIETNEDIDSSLRNNRQVMVLVASDFLHDPYDLSVTTSANAQKRIAEGRVLPNSGICEMLELYTGNPPQLPNDLSSEIEKLEKWTDAERFKATYGDRASQPAFGLLRLGLSNANFKNPSSRYAGCALETAGQTNPKLYPLLADPLDAVEFTFGEETPEAFAERFAGELIARIGQGPQLIGSNLRRRTTGTIGGGITLELPGSLVETTLESIRVYDGNTERRSVSQEVSLSQRLPAGQASSVTLPELRDTIPEGQQLSFDLTYLPRGARQSRTSQRFNVDIGGAGEVTVASAVLTVRPGTQDNNLQLTLGNTEGVQMEITSLRLGADEIDPQTLNLPAKRTFGASGTPLEAITIRNVPAGDNLKVFIEARDVTSGVSYKGSADLRNPEPGGLDVGNVQAALTNTRADDTAPTLEISGIANPNDYAIRFNAIVAAGQPFAIPEQTIGAGQTRALELTSDDISNYQTLKSLLERDDPPEIGFRMTDLDNRVSDTFPVSRQATSPLSLRNASAELRAELLGGPETFSVANVNNPNVFPLQVEAIEAGGSPYALSKPISMSPGLANSIDITANSLKAGSNFESLAEALKNDMLFALRTAGTLSDEQTAVFYPGQDTYNCDLPALYQNVPFEVLEGQERIITIPIFIAASWNDIENLKIKGFRDGGVGGLYYPVIKDGVETGDFHNGQPVFQFTIGYPDHEASELNQQIADFKQRGEVPSTNRSRTQDKFTLQAVKSEKDPNRICATPIKWNETKLEVSPGTFNARDDDQYGFQFNIENISQATWAVIDRIEVVSADSPEGEPVSSWQFGDNSNPTTPLNYNDKETIYVRLDPELHPVTKLANQTLRIVYNVRGGTKNLDIRIEPRHVPRITILNQSWNPDVAELNLRIRAPGQATEVDRVAFWDLQDRPVEGAIIPVTPTLVAGSAKGRDSVTDVSVSIPTSEDSDVLRIFGSRNLHACVLAADEAFGRCGRNTSTRFSVGRWQRLETPMPHSPLTIIRTDPGERGGQFNVTIRNDGVYPTPVPVLNAEINDSTGLKANLLVEPPVVIPVGGQRKVAARPQNNADFEAAAGRVGVVRIFQPRQPNEAAEVVSGSVVNEVDPPEVSFTRITIDKYDQASRSTIAAIYELVGLDAGDRKVILGDVEISRTTGPLENLKLVLERRNDSGDRILEYPPYSLVPDADTATAARVTFAIDVPYDEANSTLVAKIEQQSAEGDVVPAQLASSEGRVIPDQQESWFNLRPILRWATYFTITLVAILIFRFFLKTRRTSRITAPLLAIVFAGMTAVTFLLSWVASVIPMVEALLINIRALGAAETLILGGAAVRYAAYGSVSGSEDWPDYFRKRAMFTILLTILFGIVLTIVLWIYNLDPMFVRGACEYHRDTFDIRLPLNIDPVTPLNEACRHDA